MDRAGRVKGRANKAFRWRASRADERSTYLSGMFRPLLLALAVAPIVAHAQLQEDYVPPPAKGSFAVDLFGPAITLVDSDPQFVQFGLAWERWIGPRSLLRAGISYSEDRSVGTVYDLVYRDGIFLLPKVDELHRAEVLHIGVMAQDRGKRIATRIGAGLQLGHATRRWKEEGLRLRPDTLPCNECLLHFEGVYAGEREVSALLVGVEASVGIKGDLGRRWMVEFRFPIQLRWYPSLSEAQEGTLTAGNGWDAAVRFGVAWPGLFLHHTW